VSFGAFDTWWWPYLFILTAGWFASDIWRFAGVLLGRRLSETSQAFILVRAIATALVAAVISRLILFPSGALADTAPALRIGAAAAGFLAFLLTGKRIAVGVITAIAVLLAGIMLGF
jgi:hypothetical protein